MDICNLKFGLKSLNFIDHWTAIARVEGRSYSGYPHNGFADKKL